MLGLNAKFQSVGALVERFEKEVKKWWATKTKGQF